MMAARKPKPPLRVVDSTEEPAVERKGLPAVKVYFPNAARLKEFRDMVQADYEAGKLQSNSASAFLYSLYCRYARERNAAVEGGRS